MILVVLLVEGNSDPNVYGPYEDEEFARAIADSKLKAAGKGFAFVFDQNPCPGRKKFDLLDRFQR